MPKLLQVNPCLALKSTGRIAENIAKTAMAKGWDCYILHGARTVGNSVQHHYQVSSLIETYIHYAESLFFDKSGLGSSWATRRILKTIEKIQPDIVHLHSFHGYYINYKILFKYLNSRDIPVVWTFHDCWAFTGHCAHFVEIGCEKWKENGCYDCPQKSRYPKSLIDHSKRNYDLKKKLFWGNANMHIVTVSKWLESLVRSSFLQDKDIRTIYNGIDLNVFKPNDCCELKKIHNIEDKAVLVAAATAWSKSKGLEDYNKLSELLPDNVVIVLIGLSEKQLKSVSKKIIGLPRTDSALQLANYYSMADIVLNLSYCETFGLTTAEGMACGTPGVVYNATASPELITPDTGLIVEVGSIEGVLNAVLTILQKGKASYQDNCRKRAMEFFDMNKQFNNYIELYERLSNRQ